MVPLGCLVIHASLVSSLLHASAAVSWRKHCSSENINVFLTSELSCRNCKQERSLMVSLECLHRKPEGIQSSKSQALADSTFPEAGDQRHLLLHTTNVWTSIFMCVLACKRPLVMLTVYCFIQCRQRRRRLCCHGTALVGRRQKGQHGRRNLKRALCPATLAPHICRNKGCTLVLSTQGMHLVLAPQGAGS